MAAQTKFLKKFIEREESAVFFLLIATLIALIWANTPWGESYELFWESWAGLHLGDLRIGLSLRAFVNDVLMALFFLVVGCELKRQRMEGELSSLPQVQLPMVAALGGMIVPALFFIGVVFLSAPDIGLGHPVIKGWAIPSATDIAFALGIFAFLGPRVPTSLRTFLMALAIIDDMGAVVLIGLFYSTNISFVGLGASVFLMGLLWLMNKCGTQRLLPYVLVGTLLWFAVHHSGVHATLAGLFWAAFLPLYFGKGADRQPGLLKRIEKKLHGPVSFIILPLFALANAGVSLHGVNLDMFVSPILLGVIAGLFFGKMTGVFGTVWLMIKFGLSPMPRGASWLQLYGVAILCGIGFTMSLFIGMLAYAQAPHLMAETRLGILLGSTLSALVGFLVLRYVDAAPENEG